MGSGTTSWPFPSINEAEHRYINTVDRKGMGNATDDERRVVTDEYLSDEEIFHASLPIFAKFIRLGQ